MKTNTCTFDSISDDFICTPVDLGLILKLFTNIIFRIEIRGSENEEAMLVTKNKTLVNMNLMFPFLFFFLTSFPSHSTESFIVATKFVVAGINIINTC